LCQQGNIPPPVGGNHFRAEKQDASGIKGPQNEDDHGGADTFLSRAKEAFSGLYK
jgi:hypothetical protein